MALSSPQYRTAAARLGTVTFGLGRVVHPVSDLPTPSLSPANDLKLEEERHDQDTREKTADYIPLHRGHWHSVLLQEESR